MWRFGGTACAKQVHINTLQRTKQSAATFGVCVFVFVCVCLYVCALGNCVPNMPVWLQTILLSLCVRVLKNWF